MRCSRCFDLLIICLICSSVNLCWIIRSYNQCISAINLSELFYIHFDVPEAWICEFDRVIGDFIYYGVVSRAVLMVSSGVIDVVVGYAETQRDFDLAFDITLSIMDPTVISIRTMKKYPIKAMKKSPP